MRSIRGARVASWLLLALLSIVLSRPTVALPSVAPTAENALYLPTVLSDYPWISPFGIEVNVPLTDTLVDRAEELDVGWMRFHRLHWRAVQPSESAGYDWSAMSAFEEELRTLASTDMQPIVIVHHSPRWATIEPTSCGAIRQDKFAAFADFMAAAVNRYKAPEFNVHHWELGNEPDLDPSLIDPDRVFGCWGDAGDPYYGGRHYGEMLKVVAPAIRNADPSAKILIGGLLLDRPTSLQPAPGKPALFFKGILEAGAADHFDMVPYHAYPTYNGQQIDYDTAPYLSWSSWGGLVLGKAHFLRQIMDEYGVDKPLLLNETALGCMPEYFWCDPPPAAFFQAQADHLARTFARAQSADVGGLTWYTLNGPGWRQGGLLDGSDNRRPAFRAYRAMVQRLSWARYDSAADYGTGIEAHRFAKNDRTVHVVWSRDTTMHVIQVPQSELIQAYDRDGAPLTPTTAGDNFMLTVGFSPIYLELRR